MTEGMLDAVLSSSNLDRAYNRVRTNGGSPGVDGMDVEELGVILSSELSNLVELIQSGGYEPSAVLGVEIPKASGGKRLLGIPTVIDRVIQQGIAQEMSKWYEPLMSESSYGYRPGRGAHDAVEQASQYIAAGYEWVVEIDLEGFFDTLNHDRLMHRLSKGIGDKRILRLIRSYLKSGLMQGGIVSQRVSGTPQGGPLSPLLSNIYLDELDKELEKRGHRFCRYADDCNIYVRTEKAGQRVLASITSYLEQKLKLRVNRKKSGVGHCSRTNYLGYTILPDGRKRISDESLKRFKRKVRELTKRNRGVSFTVVIGQLNQAIKGWVNYFGLAKVWLPWRDLDSWIRRRLRCYRLKQCGRKFTVYKLLRKLGAAKGPAWNAVIYSQGWWHLSNRVVCSKVMGISWFLQQGLQSLELWHKRVPS